MQPGERRGNEMWSRCPFCGDSVAHPDKCHFSVNLLSGKYNCFRCGFSGIMPRQEAATLLITAAIEQSSFFGEAEKLRCKVQAVTDHLLRGPGLKRASSLDRYHIPTNSGKVDVFQSRLPNGRLIGYHCRRSWEKSSENIGARGLGFQGQSLASSWVRVVEGPYDAIDPIHDIVTFGLPSRRQLDLLKGIPVVLCPDGDIWADQQKAKILATAVLSCRGLILEGLELLPDGVDPDEILPSSRERLDRREALALLKSFQKTKTKPSQLSPAYFIVEEDPFQ